MSAYAPPGWPESVPPPGAPEWVERATVWLLDQCPPEYRVDVVLRRYPVVLARLARFHVAASLAAARENYATARADLRDVLPPEALTSVMSALEREGARLHSVARAVALLERALQGIEFRRRL